MGNHLLTMAASLSLIFKPISYSESPRPDQSANFPFTRIQSMSIDAKAYLLFFKECRTLIDDAECNRLVEITKAKLSSQYKLLETTRVFLACRSFFQEPYLGDIEIGLFKTGRISCPSSDARSLYLVLKNSRSDAEIDYSFFYLEMSAGGGWEVKFQAITNGIVYKSGWSHGATLCAQYSDGYVLLEIDGNNILPRWISKARPEGCVAISPLAAKKFFKE